MSNGENGFLTDRDKTFLQTDGDYYTGENAKNQRYETREAIAERARQAFHDFALLYEVLDERERNRIFDPPADEADDLRRGLTDTIAFLYHALEGDVGAEPWFMRDRSFTASFETVLKDGVRRGEQNRRPDDFAGLITVDFEPHVTDISETDLELDGLVEALASGEVNDLSERQLRTLAALATKPTDRLRELADLIEDERGGARYPDSAGPYDSEHMADTARSLVDVASDTDDDDEE